ncbi:uncharacterized protein [Phaseolus vulgaris]|uniref:uncharacterized protein n=1 Tax=Phaseolus vulgaris TaxID=3885 RepID=UPI0035CA84DF
MGVRISQTPPDKQAGRVCQQVLLRGMKRRLDKVKGTWAEEVPRIVWAYHTTPQSTTKETPFSLVYGSDAMIPVEIQESSPRFQNFVAEESNEERKVNLDLLDEVREEARIKVEALKRKVEYKYNSKLRPRQFQVADLLMRKAHPYQLENKISPRWSIQTRDFRRWSNPSHVERDQH